jgi:hypothetical protein
LGNLVVTSGFTGPARYLDSTLVNQLFAAAGKADQPLWLGGRGSRTHKTALDGDLDVLLEGMWL